MSESTCHPQPVYKREELPGVLRLLAVKAGARSNLKSILEQSADAIRDLHHELRHANTLTFADLEKLMRDAVTTFRGLEDVAKTIPALKQQVADAQKAAGDAQAALKVAQDALAAAQANSIPAQDVADGNNVLDQLAGQPAGQGTQTPPTDTGDPNAQG